MQIFARIKQRNIFRNNEQRDFMKVLRLINNKIY